jgi:hypothetical protein
MTEIRATETTDAIICPDCGGHGHRFLFHATGHAPAIAFWSAEKRRKSRQGRLLPRPHTCAKCKGEGELEGLQAARARIETLPVRGRVVGKLPDAMTEYLAAARQAAKTRRQDRWRKLARARQAARKHDRSISPVLP